MWTRGRRARLGRPRHQPGASSRRSRAASSRRCILLRRWAGAACCGNFGTFFRPGRKVRKSECELQRVGSATRSAASPLSALLAFAWVARASGSRRSGNTTCSFILSAHLDVSTDHARTGSRMQRGSTSYTRYVLQPDTHWHHRLWAVIGLVGTPAVSEGARRRRTVQAQPQWVSSLRAAA